MEDWQNANHNIPPEIQREWTPGKVRIVWASYKKPGTPWSREARARERRRRLRVRLERKYPMFADLFYEQEIQSRRLYFTGRHPRYDAGRPGGPPVKQSHT